MTKPPATDTQAPSAIALTLKSTASALFVFSSALVVVSAFCLRGALSGYGRGEEVLEISPPEICLGDVSGGSTVPVTFRLMNRFSRPIRVVGFEFCCRDWGCTEPVGLPLTVPARSADELRLNLKTALKGDHEFSASLTFYSDCVDQPKISVHVSGRVIDQQVESATWVEDRRRRTSL